MIEGPAGLASSRWSCSYEDALGRTIDETRPGFRGAGEGRGLRTSARDHLRIFINPVVGFRGSVDTSLTLAG